MKSNQISSILDQTHNEEIDLMMGDDNKFLPRTGISQEIQCVEMLMQATLSITLTEKMHLISINNNFNLKSPMENGNFKDEFIKISREITEAFETTNQTMDYIKDEIEHFVFVLNNITKDINEEQKHAKSVEETTERRNTEPVEVDSDSEDSDEVDNICLMRSFKKDNVHPRISITCLNNEKQEDAKLIEENVSTGRSNREPVEEDSDYEIKDAKEDYFPSPPENEKEQQSLKPKLCVLNKILATDEYGFNLHAENGRTYYIGKVDKNSIAEIAGLVEGQRIVGVNKTIIDSTTVNKDVVNLIKATPSSVSILVASAEVDDYYKENSLPFSFDDTVDASGKARSTEDSSKTSLCAEQLLFMAIFHDEKLFMATELIEKYRTVINKVFALVQASFDEKRHTSDEYRLINKTLNEYEIEIIMKKLRMEQHVKTLQNIFQQLLCGIATELESNILTFRLITELWKKVAIADSLKEEDIQKIKATKITRIEMLNFKRLIAEREAFEAAKDVLCIATDLKKLTNEKAIEKECVISLMIRFKLIKELLMESATVSTAAQHLLDLCGIGYSICNGNLCQQVDNDTYDENVANVSKLHSMCEDFEKESQIRMSFVHDKNMKQTTKKLLQMTCIVYKSNYDLLSNVKNNENDKLNEIEQKEKQFQEMIALVDKIPALAEESIYRKNVFGLMQMLETFCQMLEQWEYFVRRFQWLRYCSYIIISLERYRLPGYPFVTRNPDFFEFVQEAMSTILCFCNYYSKMSKLYLTPQLETMRRITSNLTAFTDIDKEMYKIRLNAENFIKAKIEEIRRDINEEQKHAKSVEETTERSNTEPVEEVSDSDDTDYEIGRDEIFERLVRSFEEDYVPLVSDLSDYDIVKKTVYAEARGQPEEAQKMLVWVIKNRAARQKRDWSGPSLKSVCLTPGQFDCWKGKSDIVVTDKEAYDKIDSWLQSVIDAPMSDDPTGFLDEIITSFKNI